MKVLYVTKQNQSYHSYMIRPAIVIQKHHYSKSNLLREIDSNEYDYIYLTYTDEKKFKNQITLMDLYTKDLLWIFKKLSVCHFQYFFDYKWMSDLYKKTKIKNAYYYIEAGYIDVPPPNIQLNEDTQTNHLNVKQNQKNAVLLLCGCYGPVHQGHLESYRVSEQLLKEKGYNVAGGYFSPSHDTYVLEKTKKYGKKYQINNRIKAFETIENIPQNTSLDLWQAKAQNHEVNFFSIYQRLDLLLKRNFVADIDLYFIVGDDNIKFSNLFENNKVICVNREKIERNKTNKNILYAKKENFLNISSTEIRK